ncbi:uncharacterized protein LOC142660277 [Rhinoderma darwinii]|uniref:uncharacterized protein LOC142660277 n=1 Tax=Rhinoderma darwinii TaxID=43563 RepID=UPI003F67E449
MMWKTLALLWSVSLCLSDSRIKNSAENAVHLQEVSEISNEIECRKICRESHSTNLYCSKSLIFNKWCAITLCNRFCHTTGVRMMTDSPVGINYLKKRRKRNTEKEPTNKKLFLTVTEQAPPITTMLSKMPTTKSIKTFTLETTEPKMATTKALPLSTEHPEKQTIEITEKTINTNSTTSSTAKLTFKTITTESTIRTEAIFTTTRRSSQITSKSTELVTTKVYSAMATNTESATKIISILKPLVINITAKPATVLTDTILKTEHVNYKEKTSSTIPTMVPTAISGTQSTVFSALLSPGTAQPFTSTKEPSPATTTEANITKSPTSTEINPKKPTKQLITTETTVMETTIPVSLATKLLETSSLNIITSTTILGTMSSSSSSNPITSNMSKPDSHVLTATKISAVPSSKDGDPKEDNDSIIIVAGEVTQHVQNTSFLLAVLLFGNLFFLAVVVLFALQAYESYKKKDYIQVDYLINGMYADSDM